MALSDDSWWIVSFSIKINWNLIDFRALCSNQHLRFISIDSNGSDWRVNRLVFLVYLDFEQMLVFIGEDVHNTVSSSSENMITADCYCIKWSFV